LGFVWETPLEPPETELLPDEDDDFVFFLIANTTPAMIPPSMRPAMMRMTVQI